MEEENHEAVLRLAIDRHRAGRLADAEGLYQQVIDSDPANPTALHYMGLLMQQQGRNDVAVDLLSRSIVSNPNAAGNLKVDISAPPGLPAGTDHTITLTRDADPTIPCTITPRT